MKYEQKSSDKLFSRAKELIPGGIFGHYKYAVRNEGPKFFSKAKDAYFWDVDGNKFIDLICGWGPMILGYNNPIIDKAAQEQYSLGNTVSVASPVMIELAETLVDTVEIADWALFGKNGGDSTQLAVMISRQETGKDKVLKINGGYHGANGWMQREGSPGTIDSDYRGEIKVILINHSSKIFTIKPNMRIGQIVFSPIVKVQLILGNVNMFETKRSSKGFGSTGLE